MGKPSKGTPKDKRLKANRGSTGGARASSGGSTSAKRAFQGAAPPFKKGGGRKK